MKKIIVSLLFVAISLVGFAKKVRFAVNVSNTVVAMNDVYMTSTFIDDLGLGVDLSHGILHMTMDPLDTNIYYYTADIPSRTLFEYYFEKGAAGYEAELIPFESQSPSNGYRGIYIDSVANDTLKLPAVYWNGNNSASDTLYRFRVNLSSEVISPDGVHIAGDFQSNNPATDIMYSFNNDKVYDYITWLKPGTMVHYKFYNGNTAAAHETVPSACAMGGQRMITSVSVATVLDTVCFNSCNNVCQPAGTSNLSLQRHAVLAPNPMNGTSTLTFNDGSSFHEVTLMDMYGRVVQRHPNAIGNFVYINKNQLSEGMYQLQIRNEENEMAFLKLVIE